MIYDVKSHYFMRFLSSHVARVEEFSKPLRGSGSEAKSVAKPLGPSGSV